MATATETTERPRGHRALPESPRRRPALLYVLGAVVAIALVWLVVGRVHAYQVSRPATTAAEKAWAAAGTQTGHNAQAFHVNGGNQAAFCESGFTSVTGGALPASLSGVASDRSQAIYVDACLRAAG